MMKKILSADIGGTNSRFAVFGITEGGALNLEESVWLETAHAASFREMLEHLKVSTPRLPLANVGAAVYAVAGPVQGDRYSRPPNIDWDIDLDRVEGLLKIDKCLLINDFIAQAYACRSPIIGSARKILAGRLDPAAPLVAIGAGTGLGQAALLPSGSGYIAVSSEGGHCSFPFESESEIEFMKFLLADTGQPYVRMETVLSGSGLSRLHQFLTRKQLEPAEVAARLTGDSPTLTWMARFYGRACRNLALQFLAFGGVYIAGGVAAKNPALVTHPEFERAFRTSPAMAHVLENIPVYLNTNEESGLWGAAMKGLELMGTA